MNNTLYFYGHKTGPYICFSNFYISKFNDNVNKYFSSEQYMMYHKALLMGDDTTAQLILNTTTSHACKKLGRKVKPWNQELWESNRYKIVYNGLLLKFSQNEDIKNILLNTKGQTIAEASRFDKIWGIGLSVKEASSGCDWKGLNLLGNILMDVRKKI